MSKLLHEEVEKLKRRILDLSSVVEESVSKAVTAVRERNANLAQHVIDFDKEIDRIEVEIEEECLKVLALHQPVAIDLRMIISVMKINNDLERIGDLAGNIAGRAIALARGPALPSPFNFEEMSAKVMSMLHNSLMSLVNFDLELAREVLASDDEIDEMNRRSYTITLENFQKNPEAAGTYLYFLSVSRNLERISDHATNIAEDVIYLMDGSIVRHGRTAARRVVDFPRR